MATAGKLIVMVAVAVPPGHAFAGRVLVTVYVPGRLFTKSTSPVVAETNIKPNVEVNVPGIPPLVNAGIALAPLWQYGLLG